MAKNTTGPTSEPRHYRVVITPLLGDTSLAEDWQGLQKQTDSTIFLEWLWICTWIESYQPSAVVVRVSRGATLVGIGIFTLRVEYRHRLLRSRVAMLHQTGLPHQDQIWVEYNGMLALPGHEVAALAEAITTLQQTGYCDEVHASMLPSTLGLALCDRFGGAHVNWEVRGFKSTFAQSREANKTVLGSLSSNTRYQVRRSLKLYEAAYGRPTLQAAATTDQALDMFTEAGNWHKDRWPDSGYKNPAFLTFHETLIKRGFDHGKTQLFRVVFGHHTIGVFYFLVLRKQAYFYLQGLRSEEDGKRKPGLMGHCLLMQYFLDQGVDVYDFMGGESQYKTQLANQTTGFATVRVHNGNLKFRLEQHARRLKRHFLRA